MFYGGLNGDEYCDDWGPHDNWEPGEDKAYGPPIKVYKTCKFCTKGGLQWIQYQGGWKLGELDGSLHECFKSSRITAKKAKVPISSKIYDLLSNAIQGNLLPKSEYEEYHRLMKYFKDNGKTVNDLLDK